LCSEVGLNHKPSIGSHGIGGTAVVTLGQKGKLEISTGRSDDHHGQTNLYQDGGNISDKVDAVGWSALSKNEAKWGFIEQSKLLEDKFATEVKPPQQQPASHQRGSIDVDALPEIPK
ncbi:MAG: hypothetical protein AAGJ83_02940, partial [Planctomycetota bacterium]